MTFYNKIVNFFKKQQQQLILFYINFSKNIMYFLILPFNFCDYITSSLNFQEASTLGMRFISDFHNDLIIMFIFILTFVFYILLFILLKFKVIVIFKNKNNNKFLGLPLLTNTENHGVLMEIIWTMVPALILVFVAIPSFSLLYSMEALFDDPVVSLKIIGRQWYWKYEFGSLLFFENFLFDNFAYIHDIEQRFFVRLLGYDSGNYFGNLMLHYSGFDVTELVFMYSYFILKEHGFESFSILKMLSGMRVVYLNNPGIFFESRMVDANHDQFIGQYVRLLSTDTEVILPKGVIIRILTTASDVLHSWAVPSFGVKLDACPGRLNQMFFKVYRCGYYYGQCSEICGINHAFMPITVKIIPYTNWFNYFFNLLLLSYVNWPVHYFSFNLTVKYLRCTLMFCNPKVKSDQILNFLDYLDFFFKSLK